MKKIIFLTLIILVIMSAFAQGFSYLKKSGTTSPILSRHDNLKEEDAGVVLTETKKVASVMFVGDMMFDRWIRQVSQEKGSDFLFADMKDFLSRADLVVGNLEGPITRAASLSVGTEIGSRENYVFTFPSETAKTLYDKKIRLVNIGNNHILNFGRDGVEETKKNLADAQVHFFGDTGQDKRRFFMENIQEMRIAFLNYNQFVPRAKENILADLSFANDYHTDFIVVYAHWGTEYESAPDAKIKALAHEFVEKGADLIIGTHPHVVQSKETYQGKTIYYSLGNFIFDQYFDPNTQKGLVVRADFFPAGEISLHEYPINLKPDGQTSLD